jgi:hypothetical protein
MQCKDLKRYNNINEVRKMVEMVICKTFTRSLITIYDVDASGRKYY